MLQGEVPFDSTTAENLLLNIPQYFRHILEIQLLMMYGWTTFHAHKPSLNNHFLQMRPAFIRPLVSFRYPTGVSQNEITFGYSCAILEPGEIDYAPLIQKLQERQPYSFSHPRRPAANAAISEVVKSLCLPHHLLYILTGYPSEQFQLQERSHLLGGSLKALPTHHDKYTAF